MNNFTQTLTNQTQTEKGSLAHKSTDSAVLDLFSSGVSSQNKNNLIFDAMIENPILGLKAALYLRDVRQGQGNRDILRELFKVLDMSTNNKTMKQIIKHIPEIGRWKDVVELIGLNDKLDKKIMKMIKKGLKAEDGLLAKWLPRQGAVAKQIIKYLKLDHGEYRRKIVALSNTVEQQMSKNQWSEIKYESVPSIANKKYAKAYLRNDANRRTQFLEKATTGKTTMKSSVLYPHQITRMISKSWSGIGTANPTADALWANLPNYMDKAVNVLPIIDVSGSMWQKATGTEGDCIDVALGLGLYFATHNTGSYKNVWMNFSTSPEAMTLQGNTLSQNIAGMNFSNWGGSTDIDKAMDFVLAAAKTSPKDVPKMIVIVSDMEFDGHVKQTNFTTMKQKFAEANIQMPTVVFWRVDARSGSTPITKNDKGAIILNGYSPSVMKYILSGDIANYTPYSAMIEILEPMYTWLDN